MYRTAAAVVLLALLAGCTQEPDIVITNAYAYAPVTARGSAVAYLTLRNTTRTPITIVGFRSPDFTLVSLHETVERDDRLYMQPLRSVEIAPGAMLRLQPGGKHLMMMSPRADILAGHSGKLTIETSDGHRFSATLPFYDRSMPPVEQSS